MSAYYNEFDPKAAAWLRELIRQGHIAPGDVDERSIEDVHPADLIGYDQCHFFAGIGVWSYALRGAGWDDERPVWTGSCPCQPFSAAGAGKGTSDERHLWPVFYRLIRACRPPVVFGEQVASSLVVGKFGGDAMLQLWETRELLRVRKDWLEGLPAFGLQGLPERPDEKVGKDAPGEYRKPGEQADRGGERPGEGARPTVRSGRALGAGTAGVGPLPVDRQAIRPDGAARLFDAISGQDRPEGRLYESQHAHDPVRDERGAGGLGPRHSVSGRGERDRDTVEALDDLIAELSFDIEAENGDAWLNAVQVDLERSGYACGACVAPASGFGAPHIRQRLWWVAERQDRLENTLHPKRGPVDVNGQDGRHGPDTRRQEAHGISGTRSEVCIVEHASGDGRQQWRAGADGRGAASGRGLGGLADPLGERGRGGELGREDAADAGFASEAVRVGDTSGAAGQWDAGAVSGAEAREHGAGELVDGRLPVRPEHASSGLGFGQPGPVNGVWRDADWLYCRDGKWRPVGSGSFPLAHGAPARVGRLRGYGNAIVAPAAQAFIEAYEESKSLRLMSDLAGDVFG